MKVAFEKIDQPASPCLPLDTKSLDIEVLKKKKPCLASFCLWASKYSKIGFVVIRVTPTSWSSESEKERLVVLLNIGLLFFSKQDMNVSEFVSFLKAELVDKSSRIMELVMADQTKKPMKFPTTQDKEEWKKAILKEMTALQNLQL